MNYKSSIRVLQRVTQNTTIVIIQQYKAKRRSLEYPALKVLFIAFNIENIKASLISFKAIIRSSDSEHYIMTTTLELTLKDC